MPLPFGLETLRSHDFWNGAYNSVCRFTKLGLERHDLHISKHPSKLPKPLEHMAMNFLTPPSSDRKRKKTWNDVDHFDIATSPSDCSEPEQPQRKRRLTSDDSNVPQWRSTDLPLRGYGSTQKCSYYSPYGVPSHALPMTPPDSGATKQRYTSSHIVTTTPTSHNVDSDDESSEVDLEEEIPRRLDEPEELAKRNADADRLKTLGWSDTDIDIWRKIGTISLKPIMPSTWCWDFLTFPDILFHWPKMDHLALIKPSYRNKALMNPDVQSAKALGALFDLGPLARDDVKLSIHPHIKLIKRMGKYVQWILKEADLLGEDLLPNIIIGGGSVKVGTRELQRDMLDRLSRLDKAWSAKLTGTDKHIPLYGVICRGLKWGILSYLPSGNPAFPEDSPDRHLRTIVTLDWEEHRQDVWTGFRFALLVLHCRDLLLGAIDRGEIKEGMVHSPLNTPRRFTVLRTNGDMCIDGGLCHLIESIEHD